MLDHTRRDDVEIGPEDVSEHTYRGSGAGGQHRNKTDSCVRLVHHPTGVTVHATESRSQWENRQAAWVELRRRLRERDASKAAASRQDDRVEQIGVSGRTDVSWTWNAQRSEVVHHASGQRRQWKAVTRGRW